MVVGYRLLPDRAAGRHGRGLRARDSAVRSARQTGYGGAGRQRGTRVGRRKEGRNLLLLEMSPPLRVLPPLRHRLAHFPLRAYHDDGHWGVGEAVFRYRADTCGVFVLARLSKEGERGRGGEMKMRATLTPA